MKVDLSTSAILHTAVLAFGLITASAAAQASALKPVMFMAVAPLAKALNSQTSPITVSIDKAGQIYLQATELPIDELVARLGAIAKAGYEERIYVRADKTTDYGTVMKVISMQAAGYTKIGLVTLQEQDK